MQRQAVHSLEHFHPPCSPLSITCFGLSSACPPQPSPTHGSSYSIGVCWFLVLVFFFPFHILFWEDRTSEHHQHAKTKPNKQSSAEEVPDTQSGTQHTPLCAPTAELETTTVKAKPGASFLVPLKSHAALLEMRAKMTHSNVSE